MTGKNLAVRVSPWTEFEEEINSTANFGLLTSNLEFKMVTTKRDVSRLVETNVHSLVKTHVSGEFESGDLPTIGNPDCMLIADERPLVMIEYLDPQRKDADLHELSSLYCYMSLNSVKYGIVTSFTRTLFVCLAGTNTLAVSNMWISQITPITSSLHTLVSVKGQPQLTPNQISVFCRHSFKYTMTKI